MESALEKEITKENPYKIIFVCLGNICRSPTAEGVFQHLVNERNLEVYFEIDSAGTSAYHVGESPNSNSRQVAGRYGVQLQSRARKFEYGDLEYYDLILAMDHDNLKNIQSLDRKDRFSDKITLLRSFDPQPGDGAVPDPYYGGMRGFENVFQVVKRSCESLLDELEQQIED
ncbi:low molecular weight protein-tyrosine-phosphatase [Halalkalibaculum sp. DA3122]|uniref:low molecular weight protein-tyrosine-phosphatase n=1 Tax=unclassified Halalkalibaculum TaxID=2964617 RepID=UPI0037548CAC